MAHIDPSISICCRVMEQQILDKNGFEGQKAWAFGLGLERLAMVLFSIPDIRLFWTEDQRFLKQFKAGSLGAKFKPYSKFPSLLQGRHLCKPRLKASRWHIRCSPVLPICPGLLLRGMQVIPAAECMHEVGKRHVHLTELLMPHDCTQRMQRARHQLLAAHEGPANDAGIHVARGLNWCCQICHCLLA